VPPLGVVGENGAGQSTLMRNRATVETLVSEAIRLLRSHDLDEITSEQPGAAAVTLIPT